MGTQLLVRAFDVEVGDCFYVRIPGARLLDGEKDDFHILIDCGTKGSSSLTSAAVRKLAEDLPAASTAGKKRLDLLIVTHEHQDHIKGFDPEDFKDILVEHIWLTAAMNPQHPQAEATNNLNSFATRAMRGLESQGLALGPELEDLMSLFSINNEGALETLRKTLPEAAGKDGPTYVEAGMTSESLGLPLEGATLRVLAPEGDIDHFYLGRGKEQLHSLQEGRERFAAASEPDAYPKNISRNEFRGLRSRMMSNAFAFAELASRVKNNTSVVLLIEWGGRRLLFVGDAEWEHKFKAGNQNGSWNVMWHERHDDLAQPIDLLKVGHHGSTNSTPWAEGGPADSEPAQILDAILPRPTEGEEPTAKALVSTKRKNYKTIPRAELLAEIGRRVANTRNYREALTDAGQDLAGLRHFAELEEEWIDAPQPLRTDLEGMLREEGWVDVEIEAVG